MVDNYSWTRNLVWYPRREPCAAPSPDGTFRMRGPRRLATVDSTPQLDIFQQAQLKRSMSSLAPDDASSLRAAESRATLWETGYQPPRLTADCWAEGGIRSVTRTHSSGGLGASLPQSATGMPRGSLAQQRQLARQRAAQSHWKTTTQSYGEHYNVPAEKPDHGGSLSLLRYPPMHQAMPFGVIR